MYSGLCFMYPKFQQGVALHFFKNICYLEYTQVPHIG